MTEYTLADVSAGDRVTLEHDDGSKLVGFKVILIGSLPGIALPHDLHGKYLSGLTATGWRITAVVKPEPALPTEPGYYVPTVTGSLPNVWMLTAKGEWLVLPNVDGAVVRPLDRRLLFKDSYATRLAPVPETAKAVLDRLVELFDVIDPADSDLVTAWNNVAAEFGVTLTRQGDEK